MIVYRLFAVAALGSLAMSPASAQINFGFRNFHVQVPVHNYHAQVNQPQCKWKNVYANGGPTRAWLCRDAYGNWYAPQEQSADQEDGPPPIHNYHPSNTIYQSASTGGSHNYQSASTASSSPYYGNNASTGQTRYSSNTGAEIRNQALSGPKSDLDNAVEKFVTADASTWVMNRYVAGSTYNARIEEQNGSNVTVYAEYLYNYDNRGWVRIRYANGKFNCMEFHDFAGQCRGLGASPSHGIALAAATVATVAVAASMSAPSGNGSGSTDPDILRQRQQDDILAHREIQQNMGTP